MGTQRIYIKDTGDIKEVLYLGIIIGKHSIKINLIKVIIIKEWARLKNIKNI